jgi:hypothetical protein
MATVVVASVLLGPNVSATWSGSQVSFSATIATAVADVLPPPLPPIPPTPPPSPPTPGSNPNPNAGSSQQQSARSGRNYTGSAIKALACLGGSAILHIGNAELGDHLLWGVGCFGGPLGGAAAIALFQREQGMAVKLLRPGGLRCQDVDRGRVAGCSEWLDSLKLKKKAFKKPPKKKIKKFRPARLTS